MPIKRGVAGDVAAKYVRENPDVPSKSLARELLAKEPKLYATLNAAYCHVRKLRGNLGKHSRQYARDKSNFRPNGKSGEVLLPKGLRQGHKPLHIKGPMKLLVMGDLHVPYHDERVIEAAIRKGKDEKCDGIYLNGDTCDFYALSRWEKDPRERDFKNEVVTCREVLKEVARHFEQRWFKVGNHDERWDLDLWRRAEHFSELDEFSLPSVLQLPQLKYELVQSKQWTMAGKLPLLHGHEIGKGFANPVNPARGLFLKLNSTAACGHFHQSSNHGDNHAMSRDITSCWSIGCACDLSPLYLPVNKWNWGFAIHEIGAGGDFNFSNYKVDKSYKVFRA